MVPTLEELQSALADRYRIRGELGRGGMATVYLGEDLRHHRKVAIKVLNPTVSAATDRGRFSREIEIVASLTHPHIVPLFDSGAAAGQLYYVMPCIDGESLRARIEREKQLPLDEALRLTREIASALGHAHERGLVHRDVKPDNILLADGLALVADFGIARPVGLSSAVGITTGSTILGTPAYTAPEQSLKSADVDARADIYSLGCLLYEMLAGQPPFTGPTIESVVHQHMSVEPRPVTDLRPGVSAAIAGVIAKALAKTPADRYTTAAHLAEGGSVAAARRALPCSSRRIFSSAIRMELGSWILRRSPIRSACHPHLPRRWNCARTQTNP